MAESKSEIDTSSISAATASEVKEFLESKIDERIKNIQAVQQSSEFNLELCEIEEECRKGIPELEILVKYHPAKFCTTEAPTLCPEDASKVGFGTNLKVNRAVPKASELLRTLLYDCNWMQRWLIPHSVKKTPGLECTSEFAKVNNTMHDKVKEGSSHYQSVWKYGDARGEICGRISMRPFVADFRELLVESDKRQYLFITRFLIQWLILTYLELKEVTLKHFETLVNPNLPSEVHNLYK